VRDANEQPGPLRIEGRLERLRRDDCVGLRRKARGAGGLAQDLDDALCPVLARATARHDDRLSGGERTPDGASEPFGGRAPLRKPAKQAPRKVWFGRDHVGHVIRRP